MPISRLRPIPPLAGTGSLSEIDGLTANPGALTGQIYRPKSLKPLAPLVVVLHGCTQGGVGYADAAGCFELADRHGFAVLIPQQARANNQNLCFTWFEPGDITRGRGEVASIKAMIDRAVAEHGLDRARVFVTGLSAGAAMAGAMLATYPETFAGGGLIAGLPYGTATSMPAALQQMSGGTPLGGDQLGDLVRRASKHAGSWPKVSIWHGGADRTVSPVNGEASLAQWLAVHKLAQRKPAHNDSGAFRHRSWEDADGKIVVEYVAIPHMGHGTPIGPGVGRRVGKPAPYVLDVGIASSERLLEFWGITGAAAEHREERKPAPPQARALVPHVAQPESRRFARRLEPTGRHRSEVGIEKTIKDALRAAGLMK